MSCVGTRLDSLEPLAGGLHGVLCAPAATQFTRQVANLAIAAVVGKREA